jgi:hypothetical protein
MRAEGVELRVSKVYRVGAKNENECSFSSQRLAFKLVRAAL